MPAVPMKALPVRPDRPVLLVVRRLAGRILILQIVRKTTAVTVRPQLNHSPTSLLETHLECPTIGHTPGVGSPSA
jgi:hypothetical protein